MLSFLYPPVCPLCQKEILEKGQRRCERCRKKDIFIHEPVCYSCGKPLDSDEEEYCRDCREHPKDFIRNIGLCVYQEPVKSSLAAIKYKNRRIRRFLYWRNETSPGQAAGRAPSGRGGAGSHAQEQIPEKRIQSGRNFCRRDCRNHRMPVGT